MFGAYPKPLRYKSQKVQFMCERVGRTLVAFMLNLTSKDAVLTQGDSEALQVMYKLYLARLADCGQGIAMVQFTACGRSGKAVSESIREGNYKEAEEFSNWWHKVESGQVDEMGGFGVQ